MGLFDQFPYTNFHELNLMWILKALKEIKTTTEQFVAINSLKYADPIQWNITSQYEKNTIVIDPQTGTAYISVQPVPTGVALTNEDYWTVVFDLGSFVTKAAKNFCSRYEDATTLTATFPSSVNDWLIWGDTLYYALVNITTGDSYVVDSNIKQFTVEDVVGHIQDLNTTDKSDLVAAINEVLQTLIDTAGDLDNLTTTDKSNLVAAINEIFTLVSDIIYQKEHVFKVGNLTNTTGILLGAYSYPNENDGMFFTMDGDPSWAVLQTYRAGRPTELTIQPCAIAGLCNVVNGLVTEIYGGNLQDAEYHYIWIDTVRYQVNTIISSNQLQLVDTSVNLSNKTFIITNAPDIAYYDFSAGVGTYLGGHRLASWNVGNTFDFEGNTYTIASVYNDGYNCTVTPSLTADNVEMKSFGSDYEVAAIGLNRLSGQDEERLVLSVKADGQYHIGTVAVGNGQHHPILINVGGNNCQVYETWGGVKLGVTDPTSYNGAEIGLRRKPADNSHMLYIQRRNPDVAGNDNLQIYSDDDGIILELDPNLNVKKNLVLDKSGSFEMIMKAATVDYDLHSATNDLVLSDSTDGDILGYNLTNKYLFTNDLIHVLNSTGNNSLYIDNHNGDLRIVNGSDLVLHQYHALDQMDLNFCPKLKNFAPADLPTTVTEGAMAWDSTNHKPVFYNGSSWIYADGTPV